MFRLLPSLPLIVCAAPMTPPGAPAPVTSAPLPEAVRAFAGQLVGFADEISRMYVRPVTRQELLRAALAGLYEQVNLPVPDNLTAELEKAENLEQPVSALAPPKGIPPPELDVKRTALMALVGQLRTELGDAEKLRNGNDLRLAIQGMLKCLDPYCALVSGEELRRGQMPEEARFDFGFAWTDTGTESALRIQSVVLGGPAQRAGLRPGDAITQVDGRLVEQWDRDQLASALSPALRDILRHPAAAPDRTSLDLTVCRGREKLRRLTLERQHYTPERVLGVRRADCGAWDYWLDAKRKLAQVRVGALEHGVTDELATVLFRLKENGLRGLVLDLRWSPGGYLIEATRLAGLFMPDGVIARTRSKNRFGQWEEQEYTAHGVAAFLEVPIVVLVNGETSGGAELIAAALQDHQRAVVVGQRTLGKASIQTQEILPALPNTGLKLTTGTFSRVNGQSLHRFPDSRPNDAWGVRPAPEHETPVSADLSRLLRDWWLRQDLRPGDDKELLPLDDLENDPQRQAALHVLKGLLKY